MNANERELLWNVYPVLGQLPPELQQKVEQQAVRLEFRTGSMLFDDGTPCTHYPLLIRGTIRATKRGPDGHEILLYRLQPGESCVITTVALLGETAYPAMGSADADLLVYGVPRPLLLELFLKSDPFRAFVFRYLSLRLTHLMALIDDVAFRRVDQRLAARLLEHDETITATHQMLADELGTTREVISRTLESFQESGMLKLGRKRIEILDRQGLQDIRQN